MTTLSFMRETGTDKQCSWGLGLVFIWMHWIAGPVSGLRATCVDVSVKEIYVG